MHLATNVALGLPSVTETTIQEQIDLCYDLVQPCRDRILDQLRTQQEVSQFLLDFMRLEMARDDRLGGFLNERNKKIDKVRDALIEANALIEDSLRGSTRIAHLAPLVGAFVQSLAMIGLFAV